MIQPATKFFGTMQNRATGMGMAASGFDQAEILRPSMLHYAEESALYYHGFIRTLVNLLPDAGKRAWFKPYSKNRSTFEIKNSLEQKVIDHLNKIHYTWMKKDERRRASVREMFADAQCIGRKHGDGFIILLIADGREPHEPVDFDNIHSFQGMVVIDPSQVTIDNYTAALDPTKPIYYKIMTRLEDDSAYSTSTWHFSRVLRFPGTKPDRDVVKANRGFNISSLQLVVHAFLYWYQAIMSGAGMLKNYNQVVWLMNGALELLQEDAQAGTRTNENLIKERLRMAEESSSVLHPLVIDKDNEQLQFPTRSFSGANDIILGVKDYLEATIDIPLHKVFKSDARTSGLESKNTAGLANRTEWATCQNDFLETFWLENFNYISHIVIKAKDSKFNEQNADLLFEPGAEVEYTKEEEIQQKDKESVIQERDIKSSIYSAEEIRAMREGVEIPKLFKKADPMNSKKQQEQAVQEIQKQASNPSKNELSPENLGKQPQNPQKRKDSIHMDIIRDDATPSRKITEWKGYKLGLQYFPFQERHGRRLPCAYGHIQKTRGDDGMALDCYVGVNLESPNLYAITQNDQEGNYDEDKIMIGFNFADEAVRVFRQVMPDWAFGGIKPITTDYLEQRKIRSDSDILPDSYWDEESEVTPKSFNAVAAAIAAG